MKLIARILLLLSLLLIAGCAVNISPRQEKPTSLKSVEALDTEYPIRKVIYSPLKQTYYVWENNSAYIHLIREGKEINKIGGLGFGNLNFQKLTDICLANDGSLLALDAFQKSIKRFDADGMWLLDYPITDMQDPALIAADATNNIYLYDQGQKEFVHITTLGQDERFSFGRFQVSNVQNLSCAGDQLFVMQTNPLQTSYFTALGQYVQTLNAWVSADAFQNLYLLEPHRVFAREMNEVSVLVPETLIGFDVCNTTIVAYAANRIYQWQIAYEIQP